MATDCHGLPLIATDCMQEGGLDLALKDEDGQTAVHAAASEGKVKVLEYLHAHGASLTDPDVDGDTPVHFACANGQLKAAKWLVAHGASLVARNAAGYAPVHLVLLDDHRLPR